MKQGIIALILIFVFMLSSCSDTVQNADVPETSLSVLIYDRGDVPDGAGTITDNAMTRWVQENFGKPNNIDLSFVSIPRDSVNELDVLFASGDAPDIVFNYGFSSMIPFYIKGNIIDMTEYLAEADKLKAFIGEENISQFMVDDKIVFLPGKRLIAGRQAQLVRKDWLDKLGIDAPSTTDEFYEMLCLFKEHDPGNNGDKNIPYGLSYNTANYTDLIHSFMDVDFYDEALMNCGHLPATSGFKDGVRFMNKMYNEGLISENFWFDTERKKMESDIADGYVGFFCDDLGRPLQVGGVYEQLKKNVPGAELVAVDTWTSKNGEHPKCIYDRTALFIGISSTCQYPENAIKYLEWMCDTQVLRTLQYGFEGITFEYDENNCPVVIDSPESRMNHWYNLGFDLSLVVNGKYSDNEDEIVAFNAAATVDPALYTACYENSMTNGWVDRYIYLGDNPIAINDSVKRNNLYLMLLRDCISCPPEEFDALFDGILEQLEEINIADITLENYKFYKSKYE